jgi:hypothetical protein
MPQMGFETTTPASQGAKTVRALDRMALVIGINLDLLFLMIVYAK